VVSKLQVSFKGQAQADEKAQHTRSYVSLLKKLAEQSCYLPYGKANDTASPALPVAPKLSEVGSMAYGKLRQVHPCRPKPAAPLSFATLGKASLPA